MSASIKLMLNRLKSKAYTFDALDDATAYPLRADGRLPSRIRQELREVRV